MNYTISKPKSFAYGTIEYINFEDGQAPVIHINGEETKWVESSNHKFTIDYKVSDKDTIDTLE